MICVVALCNGVLIAVISKTHVPLKQLCTRSGSVNVINILLPIVSALDCLPVSFPHFSPIPVFVNILLVVDLSEYFTRF